MTFLPAQYGQASSPISRLLMLALYSPLHSGQTHSARYAEVGKNSLISRTLFGDHSLVNSGFTASKDVTPGMTLLFSQYGHPSPFTLSLTIANQVFPQSGHFHSILDKADGNIRSVSSVEIHCAAISGYKAARELKPRIGLILEQYEHLNRLGVPSSPIAKASVIRLWVSEPHSGHLK